MTANYSTYQYPKRFMHSDGSIRHRLPDGTLHRLDGPAITTVAGTKQYHLNGTRQSIHTEKNGMKKQTRIREMLKKHLIKAGDIITLDPAAFDIGLSSALQIKVNQCAHLEKMEVETRMTGLVLHVRRVDIPHSLSLPGVPVADPPHTTILHTFLPWPDDPFFDRKTELIQMMKQKLA